MRGLIQLLHGGKTSFNKYQFPDLKELMDHLDVKLFSDGSTNLMLQQSTESRSIDTVITNVNSIPGINKRLHHTSKPFTDWSKNISTLPSLAVKEETLEERIFTKVTYTKPLTVHAQNPSENFNDKSCQKRKQSFAVDLSSKSKRTCKEPSSSEIKSDEAAGEKTLTLENVSLEDIVVQNVNSPPIRVAHEQQLPITFIINEQRGDNQTQTNGPDGSIYIQAYSPAPLVKSKKRNRSMTHPPGEVKTEEEAKSLAAPFIGKVGKPPQYKCLFDNCSYSNTRLLMAQSHVYKHLEIYTFQCHLCGLKCRLETNFEKHLNTHGVTRRKEKAGKFMLMEEAGIEEKRMVPGVEKIEQSGDAEKFVSSGEDTNEDGTKSFVSVTECSVIGNYQDEGEDQETREKCYTSIGEPDQPKYHLSKKVFLINFFV